ncbi:MULTISPECIES: alpha/beta fold hydrolase [unclassified Pseudomonas]|uniref:alpha/beta fold hydrolase n=1 Tax=unclassified Pseudomonas TaxID=196821 RepID=UPI00119B49E8|nr:MULTISPECIES: alpha/beta fold hydrolase [unclassified Pseudomonas]TWC12265.1 pimeloyl-ACP methyl ester carboxylesterase [Pseudomonas sp. SJZ075]TWC17067.1 pimeloyl-ACP methyl ester carboxylesterase [Pseudomonas sp. SJZ074]TWC28780.1 pimeloyl-ACP methyl ester carboxylesterase [Pseudomonas sp. SJZ078]TWC35179.1 pimeloyl-ACP methyl ester carboxylesterase [Pseudomonas sp. SJZ085]TWC49029.1 pimeloyl-ACP methyl ester carboxylesterase [Pseudomonas sp. SJZ124]
MLVLWVILAVFVVWSWLTYPAIGQVLFDLSMAVETRLSRLHKITVPISEMTVSTLQGGPYEASGCILMLHGYSADKNLWLRFARPFVRDYRVLIPDLPGHGETGFKAGGGYDIPTQARRIIELLDACGLDKVHVIGNSMGGYLAAWLAATSPERVLTLTLLNPAGVTSPQPSDMDRQVAAGRNPSLMRSRNDFPPFYAMTMDSPPWVPKVVLAAVADKYVKCREELAEIYTDFNASPPMEPRLSDIRAPSLLLWGRQDRMIDVSCVPVWSKGIADLRVEIWDGLGHLPPLEKPERTAALYRGFLKGLGQ